MKNALVLQHAPFEGPGNLAPLLTARGYALQTCHTPLEPALPPAAVWDLVLVMGGPMNVDEHDRHPWLVGEKAFLRTCLDRGVPVLGICLGAQLLARALGAPVTRNPHKEIGWFEITRAPGAETHPLGRLWPERVEVFHWHGDTFALPEGSVLLASSAACTHQAFAHGRRVLGLQFHPELSEASGEEMRCGCYNDLKDPGPYVQTQEVLAATPERFASLRGTLEALTGPWLDQLGEGRAA